MLSPGVPPAFCARLPPSIGIIAPVIHAEASEAKKIASKLKLAQSQVAQSKSKAPDLAQDSAQGSAQVMAAAQPETLPWLKDQPQPANAPVADGATRRTALPGMMAMGGPRDEQPPMPASESNVSGHLAFLLLRLFPV